MIASELEQIDSAMEMLVSSILADLLLISVKCGQNEQFYACGPCDSVCGADIMCASFCQPLGGCGCVPGYVRDSNRLCIPKHTCPTSTPTSPTIDPPTTPECPEFEFFTKSSKCERTCERPSKRCYKIGFNEGCRCIPGYVRNAEKKCVPVSNCIKAVFNR